MMKLPSRPKTRIRKNEEGHYEIRLFFPMDDQTEFDDLISAALKEDESMVDSDWEARTAIMATKEPEALEKRINFYRIMGIPDKRRV